MLVLLVFISSLLIASFIEFEHGASFARSLVYNSLGFKLVFALIFIVLVIMVFRYKKYLKHRFSILLIHIGIILIIIGASLTHFKSLDGTVHLREGDTVEGYFSNSNYIQIKEVNGDYVNQQYTEFEFNDFVNNDFRYKLEKTEAKLKLINLLENVRFNYKKADSGVAYVQIIITDIHNKTSRILDLVEGENKYIDEIKFSFNEKSSSSDIMIDYSDSLYISSNHKLKSVDLYSRDSLVHQSEKIKFKSNIKYKIGSYEIKLAQFEPSVRYSYSSSFANSGRSLLVFRYSGKNNTKDVLLHYDNSTSVAKSRIKTQNGFLEIAYGKMYRKLPFLLSLANFRIDRYPGSNSPYSFTSTIDVLDESDKTYFEYDVYMNNVLDYKDYRFFQSSYDKDEKGSFLMVSKDKYGSLFTYLGYIILAFSSVFYLIMFNKRLFFKLNKNSVLFVIFFLFSNSLFSQPNANIQKLAIPFSKLIVLGEDGRCKPVNTLVDELFRKLGVESTSLTENELLLSMTLFPDLWKNKELIELKDQELINLMGKKMLSYNDFFEENHYKLMPYMNNAYFGNHKKTKMQKSLIKLDEKLNILNLIFTKDILKLFPTKTDGFISEINYEKSHLTDSILQKSFFPILTNSLQTDFSVGLIAIKALRNQQYNYGKDFLPSENRINAEIFYHKFNPFRILFVLYLLLGFMLMFSRIANLLFTKWSIAFLDKYFLCSFVILMLIHLFFIVLRTYISGFLPLSNAYESLIFVSFLCLLFGFFYYKKTYFSLSSGVIMAGLALLVANLNWMNPQITNLVPVLQSYWLSIHVCVIMSSYAFLAVGTILSLVCLVLYCLNNERIFCSISRSIKTISYLSKRNILFGFVLLCIGSICGAVWANESWGRYWGWDPKETWALISIILYTILVHYFLMKQHSLLWYNIFTLWSFYSIIMTYFGVNYLFNGLHSYGNSEFSSYYFLTFSVLFFATISIISLLVSKRLKSVFNKKSLVKLCVCSACAFRTQYL
jgi:cytochrome c-type biogenesis protein CcsB